MHARWQLSAAARELKPLRQGELDGLCGLYSIINAVRLASFPRRLRKPEVKLLFEAGLRILSSTRRLRYILADGMYDHMWERMSSAVLAEAALNHDQELMLIDLLACAKVRSTRDAHRALRTALHSGMPTLVTLTGSYDHWTVISSYTKARYQLFDSWGYHWIGTQNVELADSDNVATHGLARALALKRVE